MEPLKFETTVKHDDSSQKVWINIPNTYWNRFFLCRSPDRLKMLEDLYIKFKHDDEAYTGYIKGKLLGIGISDMPDLSFKCESPEFQEALSRRPEYIQEILQGLINSLIVEFNKDMLSVIGKNNSSNN